MAIPAEVQARLGEPVVIEGLDPNQLKDTLKKLYERYVTNIRIAKNYNFTNLSVSFPNYWQYKNVKSYSQTNDIFDRWVAAESDKYDTEYAVKLRDMQIHDLEMEVSDMRGKFIIPKLKKVHTFKLMDES